MAPALSFSEIKTTTTGTNPMVSSAITVTNGDVMIVKIVGEDQNGTTITGVTATGHTFTSRNNDTTTNNCRAEIYSTVVTGNPGTLTITVTMTGADNRRSIVFERWTGAVLAATPATNATKLFAGTGGFNGSITTAAANSAVTWCAGDWSAIAPGTPAYRSSATQDGLHDASPSNYVAYYATQAAGAAGAQSFGLTTPAGSAKFKYLAVEIQASGAAPAIPASLIMQTRRAY